jgi:hypothetical protein
MIARLTLNASPEWNRFDALIGATVRDLKARHRRLRVYGEMVGILWTRQQYSAAARLEEFWNRMMKSSALSLLCGYPVDVFGEEFAISAVGPILCAHTHVLPAGRNGELGEAVERAMADVLGPRSEGLKKLVNAYFRPSWAAVPKAEAMVLWLRSNLPQYAGEILNRARQYYTAQQWPAASLAPEPRP